MTVLTHTPMSNPKETKVYDWFKDIQPKLCEYMGIENSQFRKYHEVVGGERKDLWHAFMWHTDGHIVGRRVNGNDSYFYIGDPDMTEEQIGQTWQGLHHYEDDVYKLSPHIQMRQEYDKWMRYKSWTKPLFDALDRLIVEYGDEDGKILIWISW